MTQLAFANSFMLHSDDGRTEIRISQNGGAIVEGYWDGKAIFRPYAGDKDASFAVLKAASFPLAPFGNRLEGNRFTFDGATHELALNLDWDAHYLHGDAWLQQWEVTHQDAHSATLSYAHPKRDGSSYVYTTTQHFAVEDDSLLVSMGITNTGPIALPFGIGHHPFFPMTPATTLTASATSYWTEKAGWLPDQNMAIPDALNFKTAKPLPQCYTNNGFEGWDGHAVIAQPDTSIAVTITADPRFNRSFLFVSDTKFDPDYKLDFFCFEPMSHTAGGHLQTDLGGLKVLAPGETLSGDVRFAVSPLSPS
jgi:aldose 1-epimerase